MIEGGRIDLGVLLLDFLQAPLASKNAEFLESKLTSRLQPLKWKRKGSFISCLTTCTIVHDGVHDHAWSCTVFAFFCEDFVGFHFRLSSDQFPEVVHDRARS